LNIDRRKQAQDQVNRMTRGEGYLPGQPQEGSSGEECRFRADIERRKDEIFARRLRVRHPVSLPLPALKTAQHNITHTRWGKAWFERIKDLADHVINQPLEWIDHMIPQLTPTNPYGFTCPHCVYTQSQEGMGISMFTWSHLDPDRIRCKVCGQSYPDEHYPETGRLACPRREQVITYFQNDAERAHPGDRSGQYAYHWAGHPIHVSFSGIIREKKILFMLEAVRDLGLVFQLTLEGRYARLAIQILLRFAHCVGNWLYHDYWDTVADCDPLYAAWHPSALPLEWKRHACVQAYDDVLKSETAPTAAPLTSGMLQSYWGAGRIHPSADAWVLNSLATAYDQVHDARDSDGKPLWTPAARRRVERDLLLEYALGAEPFLGGPGRIDNLSNKSPYVYLPFAHIGRILGLPNFADVALRGYEALRDQAFIADGFSRESPAYTEMYLKNLVQIPEVLHGFRWPQNGTHRLGTVNEYRSNPKLRLMLRAGLDVLRTNGKYLPLSDTLGIGAPDPAIFELALNRFPDLFAGTLPTLYRGQRGYREVNVRVALTRENQVSPDAQPGEYAVFHLREPELFRDEFRLSEVFFPAWMTAILRHADSVLALPFNPVGSHRHGDNLALYYADRNRSVLGELGYVGDSAMLAWGQSTLSHNLVVVDDSDQINAHARAGTPDPRQPSLRLMVATPWVSAVEAESKAYPQCSVYRRLVILLKGLDGQTLAVDIFRVRGGSKHSYRISSELASSDAPEGRMEFEGIEFSPEAPLPNFGGSTANEHVFGLRDRRTAYPASDIWRAVWRQSGDAYRLHVLSPVAVAHAAHGPGQETTAQVGRRLRYLDLENSGTDLASTFVTLHEPAGPKEHLPVRSARPLPVPAEAGPDAVALRVETDWGIYRIFSDFTTAATIDSIRFQGALGIFCVRPNGTEQKLVFGEKQWEGTVSSLTPTSFQPGSLRPQGWPRLPPDVTLWVRLGDGHQFTGYPVRTVSPTRITIDRFPLQPTTHFHLSSLAMS
jgi:hypothetical protein